MTEPKPLYQIPWTDAIKQQERLLQQGVDPATAEKVRRASIALTRALDEMIYGDPNHTIPERRR